MMPAGHLAGICELRLLNKFGQTGEGPEILAFGRMSLNDLP